MVSGYPDGCTQAMHDAYYNPTHDANAVQREVEDRAEEEVRTCAQEFVEWLMEREDISDLSRMIAFYKNGRTTDCRTIVDNIVSDYTQYRVATLSAAEHDEIEEML
jgi:hypothetical protein